MTSGKGIFCLESAWTNNLRDLSSVKPILQLLSESNEPRIPYIYRTVSTPEETESYLKRWFRYKSYPILYLAFHGHPEKIILTNTEDIELSLDWLEEKLWHKCQNRIIHFGSCATLNVHGNRLKRFIRNTDAKAVTGYKQYIPWIESTAFDLLFLSQLQNWSFRKNGLKKVRQSLNSLCGKLMSDLGFWMVY